MSCVWLGMVIAFDLLFALRNVSRGLGQILTLI